uniref:Uncharacterized protein n=1 Tax=Arundo donax TaxID=35708 RepID=A0A0A9CBD6_ARUDO
MMERTSASGSSTTSSATQVHPGRWPECWTTRSCTWRVQRSHHHSLRRSLISNDSAP